jgi:hypothetical protein
LGASDPPAEIELRSQSAHRGKYQLEQIFKHDSWAATAKYSNGERAIVCKFNRQQRIGIIPMRWLGWILARRETIMLRKLDDIPNVPESVAPVYLGEKQLKNVSAHEFIPGQPLRHGMHVSDAFLEELTVLLDQVHAAGIAYVDLHKRENILVGENGKPYLIDFQIGFWRPENRLAAVLTGWLLRMLQQSDHYHLLKHISNCRPKMTRAEIDRQRPWFIRLHRCIAVPVRTLRRRLLVALRVRTGTGQVTSETHPEIGHQSTAN